jgi:hypothetical protein
LKNIKSIGVKMDLDKETNEWLQKAAAGCKDKIEHSDAYAGLVTKNFMNDPLCALQLGYALLYDKPIILLVDKNVPLPKAVTRAATMVYRIDITDPNWTEESVKVISQFTKGLK